MSEPTPKEEPIFEPLFEDEPPPPPRKVPSYLTPFVTVVRAVRDWWSELFVLSMISLVWSLLVITIIGSAPATAALLLTARSAILHEQPGIRDFFTAVRAYFVRSWQLGLVVLASIVVIYIDLPFYFSLVGQGSFLAALGWLFILYAVILWSQTLSYAWAMLVTRGDLKLGQMLRNGLLLSMRYPFHNIISTLFVVLLLLLSVYLPPLVVLVVPPLWALLWLHNLYLLAPEIVPRDAHDLSVIG